jgi:ABC-2 type transport system permease protein
VKGALRVAWAFLARDVTLATSYRLDFLLQLGQVVFPLLILYLPAKLIGDFPSTREYGGFLPFSVVGVGMMNFFMGSYGSFAGSIRSEQGAGTLESVLMTPVSVPVLVLASSTWAFLWSTFSALLFIGGGALLYGIELHGNPALALLFVALTTLVFASMGVLSSSFVMVFKRGDPIGPLVGVMFFLLGGVIYPVKVLPGWLELISSLLPITHAVRALRSILLQGQGFAQVTGDLLVLLLYAAALVPLSLYAFSQAVRRATRDGTLLQF